MKHNIRNLEPERRLSRFDLEHVKAHEWITWRGWATRGDVEERLQRWAEEQTKDLPVTAFSRALLTDVLVDEWLPEDGLFGVFTPTTSEAASALLGPMWDLTLSEDRTDVRDGYGQTVVTLRPTERGTNPERFQSPPKTLIGPPGVPLELCIADIVRHGSRIGGPTGKWLAVVSIAVRPHQAEK